MKFLIIQKSTDQCGQVVQQTKLELEGSDCIALHWKHGMAWHWRIPVQEVDRRLKRWLAREMGIETLETFGPSFRLFSSPTGCRRGTVTERERES